jgi:hypothetical protein
MANYILQILDSEVAGFPSRASGEQGYEFINRIAARYVKSERSMLIAALTDWLLLRSEPKTMIALDIAGNLNLTELRSEIEKLLEDVQNGIVFMPFYSRPIEVVLKLLS